MDFNVQKLNTLKWLYVNFKWNRLPDLHMVDRNLETIRTFISERDGRGLDYYFPDDQKVPIGDLPEAFRKGYTGLAIGAQHETKKLPVYLLTRLCSMLSMPVVILGGPGDRETGKPLLQEIPTGRS